MIVIFASYLSNVCTATADIFYLNNLLSHIRVMFRNTLTTSHNSTTPQSHNPTLTTLPNLSNEAGQPSPGTAREGGIDPPCPRHILPLPHSSPARALALTPVPDSGPARGGGAESEDEDE